MEITSTELARNLKKILDRVEHKGEEVIITRNQQTIARLIPGTPHATALEAMADLYSTLSPVAGETWEEDSKKGFGQTVSNLTNPWDS